MNETSAPLRPRSRTALLGTAVLAVGLAGVGIAAATDRLDTALLFVGVPCLVAFGVGLLRPRQGWATVFQIVTIGLLLTSALLHEAAVCVLLAAPLVYGVAALSYWASTRASTQHRALALAPLLAMVTIEGVLPGTRVIPEQHSQAQRVVAADCATFEAALARGPALSPDDDRGALLQVFPYPTPTAMTGDGLDAGDSWELTLAGGHLQTKVSSRTSNAVSFAVTQDTTRLPRWVTIRGGELTWQQTAAGCRAQLQIDYLRSLDPALWFGPVTSVFMNAGADTLLAGVD